MNDEGRIAAAAARYQRAAHAMQSGVATEMGLPEGSKSTDPKHLRVGVNSAMVNDLAIAELLIAKGVFSKAEYHEAIADAMEKEARSYEERLSQRLGTKVTLA